VELAKPSKEISGSIVLVEFSLGLRQTHCLMYVALPALKRHVPSLAATRIS